jgi:hypothetical protein
MSADSDDLMDRSDLYVEVTNRNQQTKSYINIISHEGTCVPFELTNVDMLTQFFTDWNNIRTGVRIYILDKENGLWEVLHLPNYVKELCDVHSFKTIIENKDYTPATVSFLLCHGCPRSEDEPAYLNFCDNEDDYEHHEQDMAVTTNRVWACKPQQSNGDRVLAYWSEQVFLQDLIGRSKMVVLMCCYGNQIVEDYVSEMTTSQMINKIPDILYYDDKLVPKTTHIILLALLINLIDSDDTLDNDPPTDKLYSVVKRSSITILKIVKWCKDDVDKFWHFLLDMGVVSSYKSEKQKQGLPIAENRLQHKTWTDHYRVSGHIFHDYIPDFQKQNIFNNFKALKLISAGAAKPMYQNCDSVESFPSGSELRDVLFKYLESFRALSRDTIVSSSINNIYIV